MNLAELQAINDRIEQIQIEEPGGPVAYSFGFVDDAVERVESLLRIIAEKTLHYAMVRSDAAVTCVGWDADFVTACHPGIHAQAAGEHWLALDQELALRGALMRTLALSLRLISNITAVMAGGFTALPAVRRLADDLAEVVSLLRQS
jgi:hypothetical protein